MVRLDRLPFGIAGEAVVLRGQYRLSPGTLVTLADPNDPAAVPNPSTKSSGMLP